MEPISIAAAAASLVASCTKILQFVYSQVDDTRNIDQKLLDLSAEVGSLSSTVNIFRSSWESSGLSKSVPEDLIPLERNLKGTLADCARTLTQFDTELRKTDDGLRFVKQIKLS